MALAPTDNAALMQEVDEAVRKEQLTSIWTRYGRWIIAAIAAGFVALAGWFYWGHYQQEVRGEQAEQLIAAFDKAKAGQAKAAATELAALQADGGPAYRFAAILQQANSKAEAGDRKAAAALLAEIGSDTKINSSLRDLALIRQTAIEFDTIAPAEVLKRMQPIIDASDPVSSWFPSAAELAAIAHYQLGQFKQAGALYGRIAKYPDVSKSLQSRAVQMAGMLGVDAVADRATGNDNIKQAAPQDAAAKDAVNAK